MFSTHIRTVAPSAEHGHRLSDASRKDSYNLTREQARANALWAMQNAYSIVVSTPDNIDYCWTRNRGWHSRKAL